MSAANYDVWSSWNSSPLLPIFLFLLTFSIIIFSLTTKKNRHGQQLPPGPLGLPLLGYLPFLGPDLHREFTKLSETYGPIYKLWLGKKLCVVISSPTIAREVVREQDVVFANRDTTIASLAVTYGGIDIAYSDYGEYWRKIRKIFVRHMMSNANLEACYGLRKMEVWRSIRSLYSGNRVGKAVDIGEVASATMVNATAALVWGHTVEDDGQGESFKAELREVVAQLTLVLGLPNVSDFIPFMARFDLQGVGKQARKVHQWLDSFLDSVIQQAIAERADRSAKTSVGKTDILQILLDMQMNNEDPTSSFGNTELKAILTDIVTAGVDSTATTIVWVMARLLHHPAAMEAVTDELTRVVGKDSMVEEFHLPQLKYLDAVLKETFRLHPILPLLVPKTPREDTTLCGYKIPKGSKVFVNVWGIHRDPRFWNNPEEFRPERFLEDDANCDLFGNNCQYMPFGSGRRICAGIPLAEKLAKYVVASFVYAFKWELAEGAEVEFAGQLGISLKKMNALVAIPTTRFPNSVICK